VRHFQDLSGLAEEHEADVILLEYQDNNPQLDKWIAQTTGQPVGPEIFLFVEEVSSAIVWKALKLGVRELLSYNIPSEDFLAALVRVELARLGRQDPGNSVFPSCRDRAGELLGCAG
jgi:AmiR/NasT family two-component response regulator